MVERTESFDGKEKKEKSAAKEALDFVNKIIKLLLKLGALKVHREHPKLSPTHVTYAGLVLKAAYDLGLVLQAEAKVKKSPLLSIMNLIVGGLIMGTDAFDGALARAIIATGGYHNTERGASDDRAVDRIVTSLGNLTLAGQEYRHESIFGLALTFLQMHSDPITSIEAAKAGAMGIEVPKTGDDFFDFFGTHIFRSLLDLFANNFSDSQIQRFLRVLAVIASLRVAAKRRAIREDENAERTLTESEINSAVQSLEIYGWLRVVTTSVGGAVVLRLLFKLLDKKYPES